VPGPFALRVENDDGEVIVCPSGELDSGTAAELRDCLIRLYQDGHRHVVIDLGDLDFIDSTGIGVMIAAAKRLQADGGDLIVRSPRMPVLRVLQLTGLDKMFGV
jgi:anti-sigma B factor antagonist